MNRLLVSNATFLVPMAFRESMTGVSSAAFFTLANGHQWEGYSCGIWSVQDAVQSICQMEQPQCFQQNFHPVGKPNGLQWKDAPREYGPYKTLYNRFIRWSRLGVFNRIFAELVEQNGSTTRLMIDATHLKAHRTAASLLKKGAFPDVSDAQKAA